LKRIYTKEKEIDLAMAPLINNFGLYNLAIYLVGGGHGMLVKYPKPQAAINGPIDVFSLNVFIPIH